MIQDETVRNLLKLCTPKTFEQNEYICYEGQPGSEMYIVLRGSVGIYVSSAIDTLIEVSRILAGDFFGEMAIFDSKPRSASCIALEDTICVSINKDKLTDFFKNCPEMAVKLLENMSGRIRRLDNALYKSEHFVQNAKMPKFALPEEYSFSHVVEEPFHDMKYTETLTADCPICGKSITVLNLKKQIMSISKVCGNGRIRYAEYEPLWNDVWSCPYCHYSNHYRSFFGMLPFKREYIKRILKEQHDPVIEKSTFLKSNFDHLFLSYIQAIHINESVNANDFLLIGKLWLNLYWLFEDAADEQMEKYCAEKASGFLGKAYDEGKIPEEKSRQSIALSLANLHALCGRRDDALKMCGAVIDGSDKQLVNYAYKLKERL